MDGRRRGGEWDRERGGVGNGTRWGKGGRGGEKKEGKERVGRGHPLVLAYTPPPLI